LSEIGDVDDPYVFDSYLDIDIDNNDAAVESNE
jgi:hypothetical protein